MKGRVKYHFQAFGPTAVLFIEFQLQGRGALEQLNTTAQVIAECYGPVHLAPNSSLRLIVHRYHSL